MSINDFTPNDVLHIRTQEEANRLSYILGDINWLLFKELTCYRVTQKVCFSIDFCAKEGFNIYPSIIIFT